MQSDPKWEWSIPYRVTHQALVDTRRIRTVFQASLGTSTEQTCPACVTPHLIFCSVPSATGLQRQVSFEIRPDGDSVVHASPMALVCVWNEPREEFMCLGYYPSFPGPSVKTISRYDCHETCPHCHCTFHARWEPTAIYSTVPLESTPLHHVPTSPLAHDSPTSPLAHGSTSPLAHGSPASPRAYGSLASPRAYGSPASPRACPLPPSPRAYGSTSPLASPLSALRSLPSPAPLCRTPSDPGMGVDQPLALFRLAFRVSVLVNDEEPMASTTGWAESMSRRGDQLYGWIEAGEGSFQQWVQHCLSEVATYPLPTWLADFQAQHHAQWKALSPADRQHVLFNRQQFLSHDLARLPLRSLEGWTKDPHLTAGERAWLCRLQQAHVARRQSFRVAWMMASLWELDRYEAWLEVERRALTTLLRMGVGLWNETGTWRERHWDGKAIQWRTLCLHVDKGEAKVSGFRPWEQTWLGRANGKGEKKPRRPLHEWLPDVFVRLHKARTLALRQTLLGECPGAARFLLRESDKVWTTGMWVKRMAKEKLTLAWGVPPTVLCNKNGPRHVTHLTKVPTSCPAPVFASLAAFRDAHRSFGDAPYNVTNMVDGGKLFFPSTSLLSRAYLAMREALAQKRERQEAMGAQRHSSPSVHRSDAHVNNWSQCKLQGPGCTLSRFGLDIEIALPAGKEHKRPGSLHPNASETQYNAPANVGQWMDPLEEYLCALPGYREWIPTGVRTGPLPDTEAQSQCMLRVWHHAVQDLCEVDGWYHDVTITSACGRVVKDGQRMCKSSFGIVWCDVDLPVGDAQKRLAEFVRHRMNETLGRTFAGTPTEDMVDIGPGPYKSCGDGGGARFVYDDKRTEVICGPCKEQAKDYKPHALRCPTGMCRREPQDRVKRLWASATLPFCKVVPHKEWSEFVLDSSVWSEGDEPTDVMEFDAKQEAVWRTNKRQTSFNKAPFVSRIPPRDPRFSALQAFLRPLLGPAAAIERLDLMGDDQHRLLYYEGTMQRNKCWCLNRKRPSIEKYKHRERQTFFRLTRSTCILQDWACISKAKEIREKKKREAASVGRSGGVVVTVTSRDEYERDRRRQAKRKREQDENAPDKLDGPVDPKPHVVSVPADLSMLLFPLT